MSGGQEADRDHSVMYLKVCDEQIYDGNHAHQHKRDIPKDCPPLAALSVKPVVLWKEAEGDTDQRKTEQQKERSPAEIVHQPWDDRAL